jgi:hypothetical protein
VLGAAPHRNHVRDAGNFDLWLRVHGAGRAEGVQLWIKLSHNPAVCSDDVWGVACDLKMGLGTSFIIAYGRNVHMILTNGLCRWGKDKKRARTHVATALTLDPNDKDARAWDDHMRLDRHWVALILRFPQKVCGFVFDIIHKWSEMKIWYLTWPAAFLIGVFVLWGLVIWGITLFPLLKIFEWWRKRVLHKRLKAVPGKQTGISVINEEQGLPAAGPSALQRITQLMDLPARVSQRS